MYFIDVCGQLSFHIENELPIDKARLKHLHEVFDCLKETMKLKGWDHIDTWIPPEMKEEIKFAKSFGFEDTGFLKVISYTNGLSQELVEMRVHF